MRKVSTGGGGGHPHPGGKVGDLCVRDGQPSLAAGEEDLAPWDLSARCLRCKARLPLSADFAQRRDLRGL